MYNRILQLLKSWATENAIYRPIEDRELHLGSSAIQFVEWLIHFNIDQHYSTNSRR
jgi:hypothetical protein